MKGYEQIRALYIQGHKRFFDRTCGHEGCVKHAVSPTPLPRKELGERVEVKVTDLDVTHHVARKIEGSEHRDLTQPAEQRQLCIFDAVVEQLQLPWTTTRPSLPMTRLNSHLLNRHPTTRDVQPEALHL